MGLKKTAWLLVFAVCFFYLPSESKMAQNKNIRPNKNHKLVALTFDDGPKEKFLNVIQGWLVSDIDKNAKMIEWRVVKILTELINTLKNSGYSFGTIEEVYPYVENGNENVQ